MDEDITPENQIKLAMAFIAKFPNIKDARRAFEAAAKALTIITDKETLVSNKGD